MDLIQRRGYHANALPMGKADPSGSNAPLAGHAAWLGCGWHEDAEQTVVAVGDMQLDWLVVDHYALDARWERELRPLTQRIMVIDDLADRPHDADLLLDQNLGRTEHDYARLVPDQCRLLIGTRYALLRPEFARLREYSLGRRRRQPALKHLIISMGGVDSKNASGQVLDALQQTALSPECHVTVVMGGKAPWLASVREKADSSRWPCKIRVDVTDMAQLMADSDLAIGAAGTTAWERCCVGLPSISIMLADNQRAGAIALADAGAILLLDEQADLTHALTHAIESASGSENLQILGTAAAKITDGRGVKQIAEAMTHG